MGASNWQCKGGGFEIQRKKGGEEIIKIGINPFYRKNLKKGSLKCNEDIKHEVFSSHLKHGGDGCFQWEV